MNSTLHKYSTYRVAQHDHFSSREHARLKGAQLRVARIGVLKQLSSTCHVSFLAALDTDHKHKFSLTYLTHLSDDLSNTHKTFGARSLFTLRSSTTEWRINSNTIHHMSLMAQKVWRHSGSVFVVHDRHSHARN